ncbi:MAG: disulfide bond formation protein B [Pseudomonadota bacterium]
MSRIVACFAGLGSGLLLIGAFWFQYGEGLAPCKMCIWQRYPHGAAVALGLLALFLPSIVVYLAGALSAATTAGIGVFHAGVEQRWWDGPASCSAGEIGDLTTEQLFDQIMSAPMVRCDEIAWELLGISMAGWNAIASGALVLLWIGAVSLRAGET